MGRSSVCSGEDDDSLLILSQRSTFIHQMASTLPKGRSTMFRSVASPAVCTLYAFWWSLECSVGWLLHFRPSMLLSFGSQYCQFS